MPGTAAKRPAADPIAPSRTLCVKSCRNSRRSVAPTARRTVPAGSRSTFHRHGPGAIVTVTQGEGFAMVWREGEERQRFEIKPGSIYSPGDLMYHGHFNTGHTTMRHFAMRGRSPKYSQDRFRTKLHEMIPFDDRVVAADALERRRVRETGGTA